MFKLKSVESSEFNEVAQLNHQKICMTDTGYNKILVIIDHFAKMAEAISSQTASAEEICDHLITHWFSRYGCPMTFQSDKEVAQCTRPLHGLPSANEWIGGEAERDTCKLRVDCSRYMTDWDEPLPQIVVA